jgi:hypothetical protein
MTATTIPAPSARPRKQLGDQLDRLDAILDVLAEALPGAAADACREGAKVAVKEALLELLASPQVRALLPALAPPPVAPTAVADPNPSWWARLKAKANAIREAVTNRAAAVCGTVARTARTLTAVLPLKRIVATAAVAGLAAGVVALACPPLVAAAVTAVGGAAMTAVTQVTATLRRAGVLAAAD